MYIPFWCPENEHTDDFRWIHSHQNQSNAELLFSEPHPDDALRFYRMLFDYGIENGMSGFEHDYLDYNFLAMPFLRSCTSLSLSLASLSLSLSLCAVPQVV